ncbi:MAG: hypothetical protein ACLRIL_08645 [Fusicatenibacter saccharivorans]
MKQIQSGIKRNWRPVKKQGKAAEEMIDNSTSRYRDWDILKYWFRGVEKFAPWVNQIHFVTYGHVPDWLNEKHSKLHIVKHEDFIPQEFRPTFSSHPIEWNFHRIEWLTENFVYFNDDMFLIKKFLRKIFLETKDLLICLRFSQMLQMQMTRLCRISI